MKKLFPTSLLLAGGLILVLQIPVFLTSALRADREQALWEASQEVAQKWGGRQSIIGPVLIVPFVQRGAEQLDSGQMKELSRTVIATFLPSQLSVVANQVTEMRSRGIFGIPVYRMQVDFEGAFDQPEFQEWGVDPADMVGTSCPGS